MFRSILGLALYSIGCQLILQESFVILSYGLAIDQSTSNRQQLEPTLVDEGHLQTFSNDNRRPIWNLAHMVNSIKELDYRLRKGANGVEADVTFDKDGVPLYTYHGPPCDCWRHCNQQEDFTEYLRYISEIVNEPNGVGRNLSLLFLDLKLDYLDMKGKARAGRELAKSIVEHLFVESKTNSSSTGDNSIKVLQAEPKNKLKLILSVNHVSDIELVNNFIHQLEQSNSSQLMKRIGFDVGMNDDIQQIELMWKRFGNTLNLWQGDGYTNCISPFYNLERLSRAVVKRDSDIGYPRKVYHWTIDIHDRMRESLLLGVDSIMTNHPERLLVVLQEPDIAHNFRLATKADDPFRKIINRVASRSGESARFQRSATSASGGFLGSIIDVITSWFTYIKEIPFLSFPTTTRFMKAKRHRESPSSNVVMKSGPEYRVGTNETLPTNASQVQVDVIEPPYEGPKWYTSLLSNVLVSLMKINLPA